MASSASCQVAQIGTGVGERRMPLHTSGGTPQIPLRLQGKGSTDSTRGNLKEALQRQLARRSKA